jgi:hypothetical protein
MLLTRMQLTDLASKDNTEFAGYARHVRSSDSDVISELERRVNRRSTSLGVLRKDTAHQILENPGSLVGIVLV